VKQMDPRELDDLLHGESDDSRETGGR
jgi:hypothetical protein